MKICKCKVLSALYSDMGTIKCQYCMGKVDDKRAKEFVEYNKKRGQK